MRLEKLYLQELYIPFKFILLLNELIVELTEISPRDFFGNQNANIELIKKYFPKLKIVARGNKITAYGDEEVLEEFDERLTQILEHFAKYNSIDENAIERVLTTENKDDLVTSYSSDQVLVHGVSGNSLRHKQPISESWWI